VFGTHGGIGIASKVGYGVACAAAAVVVLVSGYAHFVQTQVNDIASSNVGRGGPQTGEMNILLMGLEARTYWNGDPIPRGLEDIMHIGSIGGDTTNTLILIHIFAGGKKAVGISIPRDDWVTLYGTHGYGGTQGKIDQAYGDAMAWELQQLQQSGKAKSLNQDELYFQANEAGRLAEVETVEALTGVHIDHFAELNLIGFYEMAQTFGGIEVCLNKPAYDPDFSGANIPAGYHHLNAAEALAFVRQRENLTNGDLDRTHRQQAVLDYVIWDLKHEGLLTDISQVTSLLTQAKSFMVTSGGWNIALFGTELQGLTGKNLTFQTLPISSYGVEYPGGVKADVNFVDPAASQSFVHKQFYPPPAPKRAKSTSSKSVKKPAAIPPPSTVTVDVYNGGTTQLLATHVSAALVATGYKPGAVGEPSAQSQTVRSATQVFYGAGAAANGAKIAQYFAVTATALPSLTAGHVEVLLGTTSTEVPAPLTSAAASPSPSASSSPSATPTSSSNNGAAGGVVSVKPNAPYGIPCVN
jgi:LCP family protein required for cell wall assembly